MFGDVGASLTNDNWDLRQLQLRAEKARGEEIALKVKLKTKQTCDDLKLLGYCMCFGLARPPLAASQQCARVGCDRPAWGAFDAAAALAEAAASVPKGAVEAGGTGSATIINS